MPIVHLKPLEAYQGYLVNQLRNDKDQVASLGCIYSPTSSIKEEQWLKEELLSNKSARFGVYTEESRNFPLGLASLTNIDYRNGSAEVSYQLLPKYQGKGIGTEACRELVRHAFDDLGLHRLYTYVLEDNYASLKTLERNGFEREGLLRSSIFKNGKYRNQVLLSLISDRR